MYIVWDALAIITIFILTMLLIGGAFGPDSEFKNSGRGSSLGEWFYDYASNRDTFGLAINTIIVSPFYTGMILGGSMYSAFSKTTSIFAANGDGTLHFLFAKLSSFLTEPIYFIIFASFIWIVTFTALKYLGKEEKHISSIKPTVISFFLAEFYIFIPIIFVYLLIVNEIGPIFFNEIMVHT